MRVSTTSFYSLFSSGFLRLATACLLLVLGAGQTVLAQCSSCTPQLNIAVNGTSGESKATFGNGQTICITGNGTYTGSVQLSNNGATLCIGPGVTFSNSANVTINGNDAKIINYGTWEKQLPNLQNKLTAENYGTVTTGGFNIDNNSTFTNNEKLTVNGSVILQGNNAKLINSNQGNVTINGNLTIDGATFENAGIVSVTKSNSGNEGNFIHQGSNANSTVTGPLLIDGNFTMDDGKFDLIDAGVLVNGNYTQQGSGNTKVSGGSTTEACGSFTVKGTSTLNGGTFGFSGFLGMCDVKENNPPNYGFDVKNGGTITDGTSNNGTLGCSCVQPLPVTLLYFTFQQTSSQVTLHWATSSEKNSDYFAVEKSKDGTEFREAGRVKGAGNSLQKLNYQFSDDFPFNGVSYYRLKQVDLDGSYEYSKMVAVSSDVVENLRVHPNPLTQQELLVEMNDALAGDMRITIHDALGRMRLDAVVVAEPVVSVNTGLLSKEPGVYIVTVRKNNRIERKRLVIQ